MSPTRITTSVDPVDISTLQPKDAVALTPTATLPLIVRSVERDLERVEIVYPDGSIDWVAAHRLLYFKSIELSDD